MRLSTGPLNEEPPNPGYHASSLLCYARAGVFKVSL
jgi:hypothetical protein